MHVTFVVPAFNRASYIVECLHSIQTQTEGEWSVVVVDDASTDGTPELVSALAIPGLVYLRNEVQSGACRSRNRAMEGAPEGLVAFIDSDDRLHPAYLARIREVFRARPEAALVCCDSRIIDHEGVILHGGQSFQQLEGARKRYAIASGRRSLADVFDFSTSFPGTALRRRVVRQLGGFDQAIFPLEDVDLQLRVAASGSEIYYLHESLADYRTHPGSESAGPGRALRTCAKKVECLERWKPLVARQASPRAVRRKLADARLELALAAAQAGRWGLALKEGVRSALLAPAIPARFLGRRARKSLGHHGLPSL